MWLTIELGDRSVYAASPRNAVDEKIYREAIGYLDVLLAMSRNLIKRGNFWGWVEALGWRRSSPV